ncbi:MAG: OmpA family protein [Pseudorhodobacter sp.]|nr:OmpA family protein [Pseudorhodobacter sp.]
MQPQTLRRHLRSLFFHALLPGLVALAPAAQALTLTFPGPATTTASRSETLTSFLLPIGPYSAAGLPIRRIEGALDQTAWRIIAPAATPQSLTTLAILQPLRDQLLADGYAVIFECETSACGGFDFRYAIDLAPEPDMHVDLGDFRYLAAERPAATGVDVVSLMVSRSATAGFVQLTHLGTPADPVAALIAADTNAPTDVARPPDPTPVDFASRLELGGAVVLDDLVFASGTGSLAAGDYASLADLATYLLAHPEHAVALVGHTDAVGSLSANVALSRQRAASVRQRLISSLGVPPAQVSADGVGYLAPRASNLTEEGRAQNRRVEAVLTSTQ